MFQRFQILVLFESLLKTEEDRLEIATRKWTSEEIEDNDENDEKAIMHDYMKNNNVYLIKSFVVAKIKAGPLICKK
jgi:hypothetical protein